MNSEENKPNEQTEKNKTDVWTDGTLDEVEYLKFEKTKNWTVRPKFLENNPTSKVNKFNSKTFDFEVMDMDSKTVKYLSVTSMRLMRTLRAYLPLEGKELCIRRKGAEMDTDYDVSEVNPKA